MAARSRGQNDAKRLFLRAKSNLGPDGDGYCYDLQSTTLPEHIDISATRVVWGNAVTGSARELLAEAEARSSEERREIDEAGEYLRGILAEGAMASTKLKMLAVETGFSWATIRRAKDKMGIVADRQHGFGADGY